MTAPTNERNRPSIYTDLNDGHGQAMQFHSWSALLQLCQERSDYGGGTWHIASIETESPGKDWYGSADLPRALDIARHGWRDGTERIETGVSALTTASSTAREPEWSYDVAGECPDVAAYCAGELEHMMTPEQPEQEEHSAAVSLYLGIGVTASTEKYQIENAGVALLTYVQALQTAGYSVELVGVACNKGRTDNKTYTITVPVTDQGQPLDLDRAAFALAHPSMQRRLIFAAREARTDWYGLGSTHGTPGQTWPQELRDRCADSATHALPSMQELSNNAGESTRNALRYIELHAPESLQVTDSRAAA